MCGKETDLVRASVEGAEMNVCADCARFGKVLEMRGDKLGHSSSFPGIRKVRSLPRRPEVLQAIVPDYAMKIRQAREKMGLTQEEFAKKLGEKQSIMQKMESGAFRPSIKTARKLERLLRIRIVEDLEDGNVPLSEASGSSSASLTIGDFIKVKKR
jgi:putative transcription factor